MSGAARVGCRIGTGRAPHHGVERGNKPPGDTAARHLILGAAADRCADQLFEHQPPEARHPRFVAGNDAVLQPLERKRRLAVLRLYAPAVGELTVSRLECAVLRGVGRELVQREPDSLRRFRSYLERRTATAMRSASNPNGSRCDCTRSLRETPRQSPRMRRS